MVEIYLNRLPCELIYDIFSYLSCSEIIKSFYSINEDLNRLIIGYNSYLLDLSSENLKKYEFDLICSLIHPKQIIGLKIGHTLFNLFERYLIDRHDKTCLINLQSLWIDKIIFYNGKCFQWFHSNINFHSLKSFRFDSCDDRLSNTQLNISLKNLHRLVGCSSTKLIQFTNFNIPKQLTFLHMFFDSINDLDALINLNANHLKSFGIGIRCEPNNIQQFSLLFRNYQWTNLIQLNLNLQGMNHVHWETIITILSPMYKLKYFTLILSKQASIYSRLFNGIQWEFFLSTTLIDLKTFSLKLPVERLSIYDIDNCLNTFRSVWWLNEKQWFVEYFHEEKAFMTIDNLPRKMFTYSHVNIFNTMINPNRIYSNITEMNVNSNIFLMYPNEDKPRFTNIKRLSLDGCLTDEILYKIRNIINIKTIEYFQFSSLNNNDHEQIAQFILTMSHLSSIHIQRISNLGLFNLIIFPINHIKILIIENYQTIKIQNLLSSICRLFPCLTYLKLNNLPRRKLRYLLKKLNHLEEIHFRLQRNDHVPNEKWLKRFTRLRKYSFESQIFNFPQYERIFIIWINSNKQSRHNQYFIQ